MLDQNTDRMWYVIGAVIIGAAIIFILNGTFPQLFASIGGTFESKTEDVANVVDDLTMTDGVRPVTPNPNLILGSDTLEVLGYRSAVPGVLTNGWTRFDLPTTLVEVYVNKSMPIQPNTQYTQSMYIRTDAEALVDARFSYYWPVVGKGHRYIATTIEKVGENVWRATGTAHTLDGQTTLRVPDLVLPEIKGGTYIEFGQFKLEEGPKATPWIK